ncbi:MAG: hypothetical protein ATN36_01235 [Epulopiscium sp. Nele67-Bin005]|nr:MAG: hypothetical protein ATN36_01235 [Epulopiscium sp. Nele67-Bin005]
MLRGLAVIWVIVTHYIFNSIGRQKYRVDNRELDKETKKQYRAKIYRIMKKLCSGMLKASGAEIEVRGKENLPKNGPVVYMVTHKSMFDAPLVAHIVDDPSIFIGKEEIKKIPCISSWFNAIGSIYIARDDMKQSLQVILQGIEELKDGQSVVIFPEGTRSKDESIGELKAGSFKLALKAKVPIVPIAVQNTHKLLEVNGGKKVTPAKIYANIGKPIDVANLSREEQKTLPSDVQKYMEQLTKEITD